MKAESNRLNLSDLKKELEELYSKRKELEERIDKIEYYEQSCQDNFDEMYEPAKTDIEIAYESFSEINDIIEKKEDICEKIEQHKEIKKRYPNGYKRKIREQSSKLAKDKLDRKDKAKQVAQIITEKNIKTVGIFGEWGTGKTTFLEYLKAELPKKKTKIIDIKATEYSDQEKIWAYFFAKMKEIVKDDTKLKICYFMLRIKKNIQKCIVPFLNILLVIGMIIVLFKFNLFKSFSLVMGIGENTAKLFNNGVNIFITILFIMKWIIPLSTKIVNSVEIAQNNISSVVKREVDEKLGYKFIVKEYIDEILEIWKDYHFIFCVDELDRCNNDSIMSFLEAVQLLENYEKIQIIYTVDVEIVLRAIEKAGIYNPQNYLKKYVDLKIVLNSINTQRKYVESIARDEYNFSEKESKEISSALENLEINISMRDYIHILNSLSELKERWINEQVMTEKCMMEESSVSVINWYKSLPIATFYFAGSFWPQKIFNDFRDFKESYIKVFYIAQNREIEQQYLDCPDFIKKTRLIDVLNTMKLLQDMPLIYCEKMTINGEK